MVEEPHLGAVDAWRVALEPGEVAAGVDVQEVRPCRVADGHGHVVQAARGRRRRPSTDTKKINFFSRCLINQSMRAEMHRWDQGWQSVDRFSEPGIGSHGERRKERGDAPVRVDVAVEREDGGGRRRRLLPAPRWPARPHRRRQGQCEQQGRERTPPRRGGHGRRSKWEGRDSRAEEAEQGRGGTARLLCPSPLSFFFWAVRKRRLMRGVL
jgi:hypothetical protein